MSARSATVGPAAPPPAMVGHNSGLGDGPRVGHADRVELGAHELASAVLLEGQLGPLVDAAPHAAEPRGEPGRARLAEVVVLRRRLRPTTGTRGVLVLGTGRGGEQRRRRRPWPRMRWINFQVVMVALFCFRLMFVGRSDYKGIDRSVY